jgi:hypothetical protein
MTKTGSLLLLAAVLASPLQADHHPSSGRKGHEHDNQCGHERPGSGGGHGRHRRVCGAVSVSVAERPRAQEPFSVRKTADLQFRMRLRTRDEDAHVVSFRVLTPEGHLYQQILVSDAPEEDDRDRASRVSARLPVAGTFIATSSLFGRWRVVPYLDDDTEPCAAPSVFRLVQ